MGNAGGFSSVGPSTPVGDLQDAGSDAKRVTLHDIDDKQLQDMARNLDVSMTEVQVLWQRFMSLGPGENCVLDRAVFQRQPYCEDVFCRQIWKRFTGSKGAPHKISFESFAKSMVWWQKSPINYKLHLLFSWMRDVDGITVHVLSKILKHILPSYQEEDLKVISEKMIKTISSSADPPMVREEEFLQWMGQLPEEALRDALQFRILHIDAGTIS